MFWVHVVAALVAATCGVVLVLRAESLGRLHGYLVWAAIGLVAWCLNVASYEHFGLDAWSQLLWLPSAAFTAGAILLWCSQVGGYGWSPPRWLLLVWVGEPLLVMALRLLFGTAAVVHVDHSLVIFGPIFLLHSGYCFALLVVAVVRLARRRLDPNPAVRSSVVVVLAGATGVLVAEALRLQLTDVVVTATLVGLTAFAVSAGGDFRPRPDADALVDDLGALVFVFDRDQRLVDLNVPARMFYAMRGEPVPDVGTPAVGLLEHPLDAHELGTTHLAAGAQRVRMSGYTQRLPSHGSPAHGWVTLLRRSGTHTTAAARRESRRVTMDRLPSHEPATGLLTERSLRQRLSRLGDEPGELPGQVIVAVVESSPGTVEAIARTWDDPASCVALGHLSRSRLLLVLDSDVTTALELEEQLRALRPAPTRLHVTVGSATNVVEITDEAMRRLDTTSPG